MQIALLLLLLVIPALTYSQDADSGYFQKVVFADGPIIYGTNMSAIDRKEAWKHFFFMMIKAVGDQEGVETLGVKLAPRCEAGKDFCTMIFDAKLKGIGNIDEPRKVAVIIVYDVGHPEKQRERAVCTWPEKDVRVCREFDTGELIEDLIK